MTSTSGGPRRPHSPAGAEWGLRRAPFGPSARHAAPLFLVLGALGGCRTPQVEAPPPAPTVQAWPRTYEDALGETVTLTAPPRRIVSLAPAITEMLFSIGAAERVVGVTEFCDYPPEAQELPTVGQYTGFSLEAVLELRPDAVIGMRGTSKDSFAALQKAGVPVLAYDPITVGGILDTMETLGQMVQDEPGAVEAVEELRARVTAVAAQARELPRRPRVLCAVQVEPLYAAGPESHIDDMIRIAGGLNAAGDADVPWPQYSLERMLEKDPEVIVLPGLHSTKGDRITDPAALEASQVWRDTAAVKHGAVVQIDDDLLTLPGPRVVDGLETMAAAIRRAANAEG